MSWSGEKGEQGPQGPDDINVCLECQHEFGKNAGCPSCYEWQCWKARKDFFAVLDEAIAEWRGDCCLSAESAMERIDRVRRLAAQAIGVDIREEPLRGDPRLALEAAALRKVLLRLENEAGKQ